MAHTRKADSTTHERAIAVASGTVKSFNQRSAHGFIVPDEGGRDLWVHERHIISGHPTLREGERVEFEMREAGMGAEAINVRSFTPLETTSGSVSAST
jgi:CspA family cold shock protein